MSEQSITLKSASSRQSDPNSQTDNPFSTIESAQDFVKLLTKAVYDAKQELQVRMEEESGSDGSRRMDALRIALYSLAKLDSHLHQSSRILNDLRTLRRLLLTERGTKSNTVSELRSATSEDTSAEELETQPSLDRLSF
jgi:hypothetical protein